MRERAWVSAAIGVPEIPPDGARCVATAYGYTLMGIPSATTSGSMPTPPTFTPLAGSRRPDTSCSPPKVRPDRVGHSEAVALRPNPSLLWSPLPFPGCTASLSSWLPAMTRPQGFHFALALRVSTSVVSCFGRGSPGQVL